jgi:hypothetical protein
MSSEREPREHDRDAHTDHAPHADEEEQTQDRSQPAGASRPTGQQAEAPQGGGASFRDGVNAGIGDHRGARRQHGSSRSEGASAVEHDVKRVEWINNQLTSVCSGTVPPDLQGRDPDAMLAQWGREVDRIERRNGYPRQIPPELRQRLNDALMDYSSLRNRCQRWPRRDQRP